ncbi:MAG: hypothetical protein ACREBJ_04995, partial [Nitrosotalea sp.]
MADFQISLARRNLLRKCPDQFTCNWCLAVVESFCDFLFLKPCPDISFYKCVLMKQHNFFLIRGEIRADFISSPLTINSFAPLSALSFPCWG